MKPTRIANPTELKKLAAHLEKNLAGDETLVWKNSNCFDIWRGGNVFKRYVTLDGGCEE